MHLVWMNSLYVSLNDEALFANYIIGACKEYMYEIRTADPSC